MVEFRKLTEQARHVLAGRGAAQRRSAGRTERSAAVRDSGTTTGHLKAAAESLRESDARSPRGGEAE